MYLAKAVANYFIDKAKEDNKELSPLKLIKIVYLAHGWYLGLEKEPLIREYVEAWEFGPVIAELYHEFKRYGNRHIDSYATESVEREGDFVTITPTIHSPKITQFLDIIWDVYKDSTAGQLVELTHMDGSPWQKINVDTPNFKRNNIIPDEMIQEYYESEIESVREKAGGVN